MSEPTPDYETNKPSMSDDTLKALEVMTRESNLNLKVEQYLAGNLPATERRIEIPQDTRCEIAMVIPAYAEGEGILRPLSTLSKQEGIRTEEYEVIVVVNNSSEMPPRTATETDAEYQRKQDLYKTSLAENQKTLRVIEAIQAGQIPEGLSDEQRMQAQSIIERGMRVFAVDKSTGQQAMPPESANVGTARDRGLAEAIERFKANGKDGIVAQSDSDVAFEPHYLENLVKGFRDNPDVVGVAGSLRFEKTKEVEALFPPMVEALQGAYQGAWDKLLYEKLGRQGERYEQGPEEVRFSGASMASRAFAAAEAGGVPHLAGGEDPAFSRALKKVGEVIKDRSVIAKPEARLSARTEVGSGHGQKLLAAADTLREGELKVPNPDAIMAYVYLRATLAQHLGENAASLETLQIAGHDILTPEMMEKLRQVAAESTDVDALLTNSDFAEIRQIVGSEVDKQYPKVPIIEATNRMVAIATDTPEAKSLFDAEYTQLASQEQAHIAQRTTLVSNLFTITSELPQKQYSVADISSLLSARQSELGMTDLQLEQVQADESILSDVAQIASTIRSAQDGLNAMTTNYPQELTPLEQNLESQALLKLWALNKVT